MAAPRCSVLVAAHRPQWLEEALRSALAQEDADLEVVVLDDGGPAEVSAVVDAVGDDRVRYMRNATAQGVARAHEQLIAASRGTYLGILNDDDRWRPPLTAVLGRALDAEPAAAVAFGDHLIIDADGVVDTARTAAANERWRGRLAPGPHADIAVAAVDGVIPLAQAALFRRSAVGTPSLHRARGSYDRYLSFLLTRRGAAAVYVPEVVSEYRVHAASLTLKKDPALELGLAWSTWRYAIDPVMRGQRRRMFGEMTHHLLAAGKQAALRRSR